MSSKNWIGSEFFEMENRLVPSVTAPPSLSSDLQQLNTDLVKTFQDLAVLNSANPSMNSIIIQNDITSVLNDISKLAYDTPLSTGSTPQVVQYEIGVFEATLGTVELNFSKEIETNHSELTGSLTNLGIFLSGQGSILALGSAQTFGMNLTNATNNYLSSLFSQDLNDDSNFTPDFQNAVKSVDTIETSDSSSSTGSGSTTKGTTSTDG